MTTNPPTLTYTLEEILSRLDQKIEKQFTEVNQKLAEVNQKMDKQFTEVNQKLENIDSRLNKLEIGQVELSGEIKTLDKKLSGEIKTLDEKLSGEIKILDEKVSGIDKRLDNQEFINRGVLVAVIIALISGVVKLFGLFPTGKI
jgi:chromosome segregation ATPase